MAHRINHQGTYVIDRRYKGIGRVRRASGTNDRKTLNQILSMLTEIHNAGKHSILCEIRDGVVSCMEVYGHWVEGRLDHLPSVATLKLVTPTIPDWIDTHSIVPTTKRNYKSEIKRFCDVVGYDLPIQAIPGALKRYKQHCIKRGTERTFNAARTTILAYLNNNFGKSHTLWKQVSDIRTLSAAPKRKAPQLSVIEFRELVRALPKPHAEIARTMVLTGMRWSEVIGEWWCENDRVVIKGTKTEHSDRVVPLIQPILKPTRASGAFRKQLRKFRDDISPRSFRRSYSHWLEMAGIPRSRRRMYMGHYGPKDTTDIYEQHEVESFLREDTLKFRDWVFAEYRKYKDGSDDEWRVPSKINLL